VVKHVLVGVAVGTAVVVVLAAANLASVAGVGWLLTGERR